MNMEFLQKTRNFKIEEIKGPVIHGRTKIELKNVRTGLIERYEKENTFQSGILANYQRQYGAFDASPYWSQNSHIENAWQNLVGGVFLFRDTIPVGSKYMPAGNAMIGNGSVGQTHTGAPTEMGSWNASESAATASAITQVYDFATDQANGNINCVCLTSATGGLIGYGNASGATPLGYLMSAGQKNASQGVRYYAYEAWSKNYQHNFSLSAEGVLTVTKTRRAVTAGSVFEGLSKTLTFDLSAAIPAAQRGIGMPEVVADGIIRMFVGAPTAVAPGSSALYIEYNASAETAEVKALINSSAKTINVGANAFSKFFLGDYAILVAHNAWEVIKVDTGVLAGDLPTLQDLFDGPTTLDFFPDSIGPGLIVYRSGNSETGSMYIFDAVAGTTKTINLLVKAGGAQNFSAITQHGEYDIARGIFNYDRGIVIKNPLYLATINNLDTPVPKTAAQTMKVTYTLTEV